MQSRTKETPDIGAQIHEVLPPEVMSRVFTLFNENLVDGRPQISKLALVCSQWADIVRSTPELFTRYQLTFYYGTPPDVLTQAALDWFARSGSLPVDLSICYGWWGKFGTLSTHLKTLLDTIAARLRVFRCRVRRNRLADFAEMLPPLPFLECLDFTSEVVVGENPEAPVAFVLPSFVVSSPSLKHLVLHGTFGQAFTRNIESFVAWRRLTQLDISDIGVPSDTIRKTFFLCTNIKEASFRLMGWRRKETPASLPPTRLAYLHKLAISMGDSHHQKVDIAPFFSSLSLPSLIELRLENTFEKNRILPVSQALLQLHTEQPFALQKLVIKLVPVELDELCQLLSYQQTLTSIDLFGPDYLSDKFFKFLNDPSASHQKVLPDLVSIKLNHLSLTHAQTEL
ncbi:hypothetical protein BDN72DRAFT_86508 [Pluteus cervinus]|uniref:Uncharacterized protein n=1 Tax=Pluteus cervinus TaxID=181527 RepID=A0ACD3APR9_9AGAR|nr:hypothetical protein BDN72DRAFT_86508 [Pluteus cervinus]